MSSNSKSKGRVDWLILLGTAGLILMSTIFVYSASVGFANIHDNTTGKVFIRHTGFAVIGLALMLITSQIPYQFWQKRSQIIMLLGVAMLIGVFLPQIGHTSHGARRWISLGSISFQASEIIKVALIIHFSALLVRHQDHIKDFKTGFLPFLFWIIIVSFLIALQPNFSTMMVLFGISMALLFVGNANLKHIFSVILGGLLAGSAFAMTAEYRRNRILQFLGIMEKQDNALSEQVSHQITQSLIAIGNGGWTGVGIGQSRQSHRFLPEAHSDFIFSIIGEEYGFIGLFLILLVFGIIFYRGFRAAKNAPDDYGYFLGAGIIIVFSTYLIINAGVCTNLLPTTGLPLPFISYGGTALLINSATMGILLNISAQANVNPSKKKSKSKKKKSKDDEYKDSLEAQNVKLMIDQKDE